jgi:hypothetical protein
MANDVKKMKLIRIVDGLYRNESGLVRVSKQLAWRGQPSHWAVRYDNWHGCPITKKFPTLSKARHFLNTGQE